MCLICVDLQKDNLTVTEAWRNLLEMKDGMPDEHYDEVVALVIDRLYDEQVETSDEDELGRLMDKLEDDGKLSFGYDDVSDVVDEIINNDDIYNPWYIADYED